MKTLKIFGRRFLMASYLVAAAAFILSSSIVLTGSVASAKKKDQAPAAGWIVYSGDQNLVARSMTAPRFKGPISEKEKERVEATARSQGFAQAIFVDGFYNPVSPDNIKPIDVAKDCGANNGSSADGGYCRGIDGIINLSRGVFDCPAVQYSGVSVLAHPGMRQMGIDKSCVQTKIAAALESAKQFLSHDRNLDWASGALSLQADCKMNMFEENPNYCDAFDMSVRESFTTDMLNLLKSHPRPLHEVVTTRILFNNQLLSLATPATDTPLVGSNPAANANAPAADPSANGAAPVPAAATSTTATAPDSPTKSSMTELIWGEFDVDRVDPNSFPGEIVVEYRNQPEWSSTNVKLNMAYAIPFTGTLQQFAENEARGQCANKGGALNLNDEGNGSAYVGLLDQGQTVSVFYLSGCKIPVN